MTRKNDGSYTGRRVFACRVDKTTPQFIDDLALQFGCRRIDKNGKLAGATGVLLDQIAKGNLKVVPSDA